MTDKTALFRKASFGLCGVLTGVILVLFSVSAARAATPPAANAQNVKGSMDSPISITLTGSVQGETEQTGDAYTARGLWHLRLGPVNAGLGGSVLRRDRPDDSRRVAGGIWYLAAGPVTWLGEIDETRFDDRLGNLVSQEVTVRVKRGFDLRGTYSFQDPDRHLKNGSRQRYGGGLVWMPLPVFNLLAMGNYWKIDEGELVTGSDYLEGELVLHLFY